MKDKNLNALAFLTWSPIFRKVEEWEFQSASDYLPAQQTRERLILFGLFGNWVENSKLYAYTHMNELVGKNVFSLIMSSFLNIYFLKQVRL